MPLLTALAIVLAARAVFLTLALGPFWRTHWMVHVITDVWSWLPFFRSAQAGGIPYVDFTKEYPVGAGLLYWAMSPFVEPADLRQTVFVHALFMLAGDLVMTALAFFVLRDVAPRFAVAGAVLLALNPTAFLLSPFRFEPWLMALALAGYACHLRGRPLWATFFWSVGCAFKWYPAFFIAAQEYRALAVQRRRWQWLGSALVFAAVLVAFNAPFVALALSRTGGLDPWLAPYRFHVERPLYWDTLLGVGQLWLGPLPVEKRASLWTLPLVLAALLARPRLGLEYKGTLMCLAAIFLNRIYSTQFHLWFAPLLLLGAVQETPERRRRIAASWAVLEALNVLVYPFSFAGAYREMGGFEPLAARLRGGPWTVVFSVAIALRTVALAALAALLLRAPPQPGQSADAAR